MEIPVIFKLVTLLGEQGDDGGSMRLLLILQITSISFLFYQSRNVEQLGHSVYHSNHFINHYYMVAHRPNAAIHFSFLHHEIFIQFDVTSQVNFFYDSLNATITFLKKEKTSVATDAVLVALREIQDMATRNPGSCDTRNPLLCSLSLS